MPVLFTSVAATVPSSKVLANGNLSDSYVKVEAMVTPTGTSDSTVLACAPSPVIKVAGKKEKATFVVDLSKNVLYHYDDSGKPLNAYLIASGSSDSPTHTGIRKISHVETYPYKYAPKNTKRRRSPRDFGPKIIILDMIDAKQEKISVLTVNLFMETEIPSLLADIAPMDV